MDRKRWSPLHDLKEFSGQAVVKACVYCVSGRFVCVFGGMGAGGSRSSGRLFGRKACWKEKGVAETTPTHIPEPLGVHRPQPRLNQNLSD